MDPVVPLSPYSPEGVEGLFCELRPNGFLRSSEYIRVNLTRRAHLLLFALRNYAPKGRDPEIGRIALLLAAMVTAILSLGVTFFAAETTAAAETTNVTSIADSSILQNAPTTNYGATTLGADGDEPSGSGKDKYGLLRWDLASIAPGTKIS